MQLLVNIIGLGLLGLDPVAAIMVASAIAVGTTRSKIFLFTLVFLLGTTFLGVALSMMGQTAIDFLQAFIPDHLSPLWAILNLIIIIVIIAWLTTHFVQRTHPKPDKPPRKTLASTWQCVSAALLLALSALSDPTFYAVIVIAAKMHTVFAMAVIHFLWILISQIPLIVVVGAYHLNAHKTLLHYSARIWTMHQQKIMLTMHIAAIMIALLLLAETVFYVVSGQYFF